jgi:hypothetical protein
VHITLGWQIVEISPVEVGCVGREQTCGAVAESGMYAGEQRGIVGFVIVARGGRDGDLADAASVGVGDHGLKSSP